MVEAILITTFIILVIIVGDVVTVFVVLVDAIDVVVQSNHYLKYLQIKKMLLSHKLISKCLFCNQYEPY